MVVLWQKMAWKEDTRICLLCLFQGHHPCEEKAWQLPVLHHKEGKVATSPASAFFSLVQQLQPQHLSTSVTMAWQDYKARPEVHSIWWGLVTWCGAINITCVIHMTKAAKMFHCLNPPQLKPPPFPLLRTLQQWVNFLSSYFLKVLLHSIVIGCISTSRPHYFFQSYKDLVDSSQGSPP